MVQEMTVLALVWPFVSTWMLLWGLAAVIPIVIRLVSRLHHRQAPWAAMEYLLAAINKRSRRIRIEQWLLLLIRTMILLLLGLALADPILPWGGVGGGGPKNNRRTHWVLVIDGSYSMDYRDGEQSRFEQAKQQASELLDKSKSGDGFTLVLMSNPPQVVVGQVAFDPKDVRDEIDQLQLTHGGADLSATLAEIEKIVQQTSKKRRRLKDHKVCVFSDLGLTTWKHVTESDCRKRLSRLPKNVSLALFDVGQSSSDNMAITNFSVRQSLLTVGRPVSFDVEIQNFGGQDRSAVGVEFIVDGESVKADEKIDVIAAGRTSLELSHHFATAGEHRVEVRLIGDRLEVDNHRWLSVPVRESIEVLCVGGTPGSARSVASALQPERSDAPRIRPTLATEVALLELDLNDYECIFLCNVARFNRNESDALREYLENGGGLIVFLGDRVDAESYNRELAGTNPADRVLPAQLGNAITQSQYQFDTLDYRHPIVSPFRGFERAGLRTTPIWKYYKLVPYPESTAQTVLSFVGGDPVIVEQRVARGRSILVATAASSKSVDRTAETVRPWTLLSAWPSFLPLVQEMLAFGVQGRHEGRNVEVGDDLNGWRRSADPHLTLTVVGPQTGEEREQIDLRVDGENSRWVYPETWVSGIYEARYGEPEPESIIPSQRDAEIFAVNVDTRESNLERFELEMLPGVFSRELPDDSALEDFVADEEESPVFQYVLAIVLFLLFLETLLAWRFGRAKA